MRGLEDGPVELVGAELVVVLGQRGDTRPSRPCGLLRRHPFSCPHHGEIIAAKGGKGWSLWLGASGRLATLEVVSYHEFMDVVVDWNGVDMPEGLRELPKGRYVVVAVDEAAELSAEEEAGLEAALASLREGRGVSLDEARARVSSRLDR